jgi:DNA-binding transcriptional MerR regulator
MSILDEYRKWEGNIDDLTERAREILLRQIPDAKASDLSVRLVRDYAQRGILSRAERAGKEVRYGFRHLLELVAARGLLMDGWPLAKIASYFGACSDADLERLVPDTAPENRALSTVQRFLAASDADVGSGNGFQEDSMAPSKDAFTNRAAVMAERRTALTENMARLGSDEEQLQPRSMTHLRITEWCDVLIESSRLEALSLEDADDLGRAIALSLSRQHSKGRKNHERN